MNHFSHVTSLLRASPSPGSWDGLAGRSRGWKGLSLGPDLRQLEDGHENGENDNADDPSDEHHHDGVDDGGEPARELLDLLPVEGGQGAEDVGQFPGFLPHPHHLRHERREHAGFLERLGYRLPRGDVVLDRLEGLGEYLVRGEHPFQDRDRVEDADSAFDERKKAWSAAARYGCCG